MSYIQIKYYKLAWNTPKNKGRVELFLLNNKTIKLYFENPTEFAATTAILRETPVFINEHKTISSSWEQS